MSIQSDFENLNTRREMLLKRETFFELRADEAVELKELTERIDAILGALYPAEGDEDKAIEAVRFQMRARTGSSQTLRAVRIEVPGRKQNG